MINSLSAVVLFVVVAAPDATFALGSYRSVESLPNKASGLAAMFNNHGPPHESAKAHLKLHKDCELREEYSMATKRDTVTRRYHVWAGGIPVFNAVITVEADRDGTSTYSLHYQPEALGTFEPRAPVARLSNANALAMAAAKFSVSASILSKFAKNQQTSKVWFYDGTKFSLCIHAFFDIDVVNAPLQPHILVDVETKEVRAAWDGVAHQDITWVPQFISGYLGNPGPYGYRLATDIWTDVNNSYSVYRTSFAPYYMVGSYTETTELSPWDRYIYVLGFQDVPDPYRPPPALYDYTPAIDAVWAARYVWAMYASVFGQGPGGSNAVTMNVQYMSVFANSYTITSTYTCTFGNGDSRFYSLTSPDLIAHEVSHIFTSLRSGLLNSGQTYGINEAYSDIAGQALLAFVFGSNDFCVAGRSAKTNGTCLRYMCNPKQDGVSIDNAANYVTNMDGHYSAGVFNKAFCLIAKSPGWSTITAWQVFAVANALYWNPTSTFAAAACGVYHAAKYNWLVSATRLNAIITSFAAVGVTVSPSC